jgi:hypothetical protein
MSLTFDPGAYGDIFAALLEPRLPPLGPGTPNRDAHTKLRDLDLTRAFAPRVIADHDMARACHAGLWLYHDYLDESHAISQEIPGATGSLWHGIMHRREPDHANAAYWMRRVGTHPVYDDLARAAAKLGYAGHGSNWDAFAFNDACERHRGKGDTTEELLRRVQLAEWELLFAWCHRCVTGS